MTPKKIAVAVELDEGILRRAHVPAPDPDRWSEEDARAFVWAVWDLLEAHAVESFSVREVQPCVIYRLEFVADRGVAVSEPLALSMPALEWMQSASFVSTS